MKAERHTRREFFERAAAGGASFAMIARFGDTTMAEHPAAELGEPAKGTAIDAHVHVWTPDTAKYPLSAGYMRDEMVPASFTPEQLFAHMRPCGVGRVVLVQMSFYGFDNSYMLDSIRAFPSVFSGIAVIDDSVARPQDEMRRLKPLGVRGFRIYPRNMPVDRWLESPGLKAMWECGAAERLAMCCLVNPDALPAIDRMCEDHADTPVVIDHCARIGMTGEIHEADLTQLCRLARHKNTYVKISAFYALGKKKSPYTDLAPMIRKLYEAFGAQRLMWATDCPYQVQGEHTYPDSIELVRSRLDFLGADDRAWLLHKTAERVFFS
ncbi:MAG TPA: amidohydrolase family protein [Pirellulales bacterium]|nr:amidohydrolase family protein [Pirellulales bacterium]